MSLPTLIRMCGVCDTKQGVRKADGAIKLHGDCPGGGQTPDMIETMMRTFVAEGSTTQVSREVEVIDNGDSIILVSALSVEGEIVASVDVRIKPHETRRLIAQLTAIADKRDL